MNYPYLFTINFIYLFILSVMNNMVQNCEYCGFPLINEEEKLTGLHLYCLRYFEKEIYENFDNT